MNRAPRGGSLSVRAKSILANAVLLLLLACLLGYQGLETRGTSRAIQDQQSALIRLKSANKLAVDFSDFTHWMMDHAITQLDESEAKAADALRRLEQELKDSQSAREGPAHALAQPLREC